MKRIFPALILISFLGLAVFGAIFFNMGPGHTGGCLASSIDGKDCSVNMFEASIHHISAFLSLSEASPLPITYILLDALLLVAALYILGFTYRELFNQEPVSLLQNSWESDLRFYRNRKNIISWLAQLELSPVLA